jgi:hypothetical protein
MPASPTTESANRPANWRPRCCTTPSARSSTGSPPCCRSVLPPATLLVEALEEEVGHGGAAVYGSNRHAPIRTAALIIPAASDTVEFDDIFRDAVYHPGCPVIGAALAAAQARGATGLTLLRAIVVGYEVSTRTGVGVQPSRYRCWPSLPLDSPAGARHRNRPAARAGRGARPGTPRRLP